MPVTLLLNNTNRDIRVFRFVNAEYHSRPFRTKMGKIAALLQYDRGGEMNAEIAEWRYL
jgi:hypothetical protein